VTYGACANTDDADAYEELEEEEEGDGDGDDGAEVTVPCGLWRSLKRAARVRSACETKVLLPVRSARW
jgi:hypothetical protein